MIATGTSLNRQAIAAYSGATNDRLEPAAWRGRKLANEGAGYREQALLNAQSGEWVGTNLHLCPSTVMNASLHSPSPQWVASWFRKGVVFAAVICLHAALVLMLAQTKSSMDESPPSFIKLMTVSQAPQPEVDKPLTLSPPQYRLDAPLMVEPEIIVDNRDTVRVENQPITPAETAASAITPAAAFVPKLVSSVEYLRAPAPKYPPAARALKQRGTVMLRALIDTDGRAREVNVHQSSGYRLLDDAARQAVFDAVFIPYSENGQPLLVYVFIPIEFVSV